MRGPFSPTLARFRRVIARVPRGKVITYGQVAAAAGHPGAARVTVWALQADAALPWYRVVAAGGRIALPGPAGKEQRLRLAIEGVTFRGGRVRMDRHSWTPRLREPDRARKVSVTAEQGPRRGRRRRTAAQPLSRTAPR